MEKLISIDFKSDLGFFKNPQYNGEIESKHYSFDSIHKPAILGMLGNLLGLNGAKKDSPIPFEYYHKLNHIKIGIKILTPIKKEWEIINSSSGLFSKQEGGVLNLDYQFLIKPEYRIYLLLNLKNELEEKLYSILRDNLVGWFGDIYMGKSSFIIYRDNFTEYNYQKIENLNGKIDTIFLGKYDLITNRKNSGLNNYDIDYIFNSNKNDIYERSISLPTKLVQNKVGKYSYPNFDVYNYTNKDISFLSDNIFKLEDSNIFLI